MQVFISSVRAVGRHAKHWPPPSFLSTSNGSLFGFEYTYYAQNFKLAVSSTASRSSKWSESDAMKQYYWQWLHTSRSRIMALQIAIVIQIDWLFVRSVLALNTMLNWIPSQRLEGLKLNIFSFSTSTLTA